MSDKLGEKLFVDSESESLQDQKTLSLALSCIAWFNQHPQNLEYFVKTLKRQTGVSLRVIDYAVTSFSRRHRVTIHYHGRPLDLNNDYKRHLVVHTKKLFDVFARRSRITLTYGSETLSTTVGQLNFFRWLLERNIQTILLEMKAVIEADMKEQSDKHQLHEDNFLMYAGPFTIQF